MALDDYTPEEALRVLVEMVAARDVRLADEIRGAIDQGKDVREETRDGSSARRRRRAYRRTVRYSPEEALDRAIEVLRAHFVEAPSFIVSATAEFSRAKVGGRAEHAGPPRVGAAEDREAVITAPLTLEIELQTETQISETANKTMALAPLDAHGIDEQERNIARLRELTEFRRR